MLYTLYNMKTPKPSPTITAHLLAIKQALATSPSTLPMRNTSVRVIPEYVPFRHCTHLFKELNVVRETGIEELISEMTDKVNEYLSILDKPSRREANHLLGVSNGRERCSIRYDTEFAPLSTNSAKHLPALLVNPVLLNAMSWYCFSSTLFVLFNV